MYKPWNARALAKSSLQPFAGQSKSLFFPGMARTNENRSGTITLLLFATTWLVMWLPFDAVALWPTLLALSVVLILKRTFIGLLTGAMAGSLMLANGDPAAAFAGFFTDHLIPSLQSGWNLSVLIFTLLLGGFAALIEKGGGLQALFHRWIDRGANSARRVQFSAYGLGLACFFDGLASSMLTGKAIRPLADRSGVSRPMLAYIVDSTSSAVACVAFISTWIAYQLSMIREGYKQAGIESVNAFAIFFQSIPLNFYCWFTLWLVAVAIWKSWHPGPMGDRERKYATLPTLDRASATPAILSPSPPSGGTDGVRGQPGSRATMENPNFETPGEGTGPTDGRPGDLTRCSDIEKETVSAAQATSILGAVIPLLFLIIGLIVGLYISGTKGELLPFTLERAAQAFGDAQAANVLLYVSALGCLVAFLFNHSVIRQQADPGKVFMEGVLHLFQPCLILIAAWCLSSTLSKLGAAKVLSTLLSGNMTAAVFPAAVFVVGILISFTTGTSWGTMGILMPLAVPVAINLGGDPASTMLVSATVAAVFSGAVFGDHCSPLSDTTIVSSMSCEVEPIEHVRTQLPYALIAAGLALFTGFLPAGFGLKSWFCLLTGFAIITFLPEISRRFTDSRKS